MRWYVRLRGERLVVLALLVLVTFFSLLYVLLEKADEFSPKYFTNTVLLTVLGFANAILVLALLYVLFRNLILLVVERRRGTLGSQFRTKLVFIFLGLTLIPSMLLFVAAGRLIEHSIKKWFSTPVDEVVRASQQVLEATYSRHREDALHFAGELAAEISRENLLDPSSRRRLRPVVEARLRQYGLDLALVSAGGEAPLTVVDPALSLPAVVDLPWDLLDRAQAGRHADRIDPLGEGLIVRAAVVVPGQAGESRPAVVAVGYVVPGEVAGLTTRMARAAENYLQTKALRNPIRRSYTLILVLVAVVVVFSAVWVGMSLARRITVPIQKLAEGTREVAAGNLDFQLKVETDDEFGMLVDSFNRMTSDLSAARGREEASRGELSRTNRELDQRRGYIETLLENITPGVLSLGPEGRITTINRSACRILGIDRPEGAVGMAAADLLSRPEHAPLRALLDEVGRLRQPIIERPLALTAAGRTLTLTSTVTALTGGGGEPLGLFMVLEDVTQLIRAEKAAAWQEVARQLAHEIKNPLTPIQLSAQRIAKKFAERAPDLPVVIEEGTRAIVTEVAALKGLLDEFSKYARLPAVRPVPADVHQVLDQAIALYEALPAVRFRKEYGANGRPVAIDPEQMKRVCVNLFDNAVEAMDEQGTITVTTRTLKGAGGVSIEIADEGRGVAVADRERMFLPYFSTKKRGTGLGLAIVHRIVAEHDGTVRFEENRPRGSRFIIDLPAAA